jgi:hypothetical protein
MARKVCQFGERVRSEMEGWSCVVEILEINFMSSYRPHASVHSQMRWMGDAQSQRSHKTVGRRRDANRTTKFPKPHLLLSR